MSRFATIVRDAVLLLLLVMSIPFGILILGTPLTFIIRLALEILRAVF